MLDAQQAVLAIEAGARFPACPALSAEVLRAAHRHGGAGHGRGRDTDRDRIRFGAAPGVAIPEDREQRPGAYDLTISFMPHAWVAIVPVADTERRNSALLCLQVGRVSLTIIKSRLYRPEIYRFLSRNPMEAFCSAPPSARPRAVKETRESEPEPLLVMNGIVKQFPARSAGTSGEVHAHQAPGRAAHARRLTPQ